MKNIIMFFCLMLGIISAGCKKQEDPIMSLFAKNWWGWANAEVNNKQWNALGCRAISKADSVDFEFNEINEVQILNTFGMGLTPLKVGKRFMPKTYINNGYKDATAGYISRVRGDNDLICATYLNLHNADSLQNWIDITEYNPETKEIKGKFSYNLLINPKGGNAGVKCNSTDPDILRIRNGTFHTKITRVL